HAAALLCDPSARSGDRHPRDPGVARPPLPAHDRPLRAGLPRTRRHGEEPARRAVDGRLVSVGHRGAPRARRLLCHPFGSRARGGDDRPRPRGGGASAAGALSRATARPAVDRRLPDARPGRPRRRVLAVRLRTTRVSLVSQPTLSEVSEPRASPLDRAAHGARPRCRLLPRRLHAAGRPAIARPRTWRPVFALLLRAAAQTLLTLGHDPKRLGAEIGITAVLHTWTRELEFHPHVHCIVTAGGFTVDRRRWRPAPPATSLPGPCPRGAVLRQGTGRPPAQPCPGRAVFRRPGVDTPHPRRPPRNSLARLREAPLRRGEAALPIPRPLHPSRRPLESPTRRRHSRGRDVSHQGRSHGHVASRGIPPPAAVARPPSGIRENPPQRPVRPTSGVGCVSESTSARGRGASSWWCSSSRSSPWWCSSSRRSSWSSSSP